MVGELNGALFIRMWKPLPSKYVLKTLKGSSKGKVQGEQHPLVVGLRHYKWYQSKILGDVPARRLSLEGEMDTRRCASKDARSRRGWIGESYID